MAGDHLLSHRASAAVPSASQGLTSVFGMGTGRAPGPSSPAKVRGALAPQRGIGMGVDAVSRLHVDQATWTISTDMLRASPRFHTRPINLVVFEGPWGELILRGASHLDAFSGYPVRTWLPGSAAGATTGTPEVRPPRSSRTRGSSSQLSNAHGR